MSRRSHTCKKIAGLFFLCIILAFKADRLEGAWELKKSESGVTVYTRMAANSNYKELKSVFQVKTSLSSFMSLIGDFESYPKWVYRCGSSKTIKKISNYEYIHYQTVTAPWPVDNRDVVMKIKITQDPVTKMITQRSTAIPDSLPEVKDHVRIRIFNSQWTIVPQKDGILNAEFRLLVEPGGNIPAWLVNLAVVDGPFETNVNLKEWVFKEKYQKAKLPHIKELSD